MGCCAHGLAFQVKKPTSKNLPVLHIVYPGKAESAFEEGKRCLANLNEAKSYHFNVKWLEISKPSPCSSTFQFQSKAAPTLCGIDDPAINQSIRFFNEFCYAAEYYLFGKIHSKVFLDFNPTDLTHNKPITFDLPYWSDTYPHVERKTLLAQLKQHFKSSPLASTSTQPAVVTACHGLGGIGKSHLAAYYARHPQHAYRIIGWIDAKKLENSYCTLGESLGLFKTAKVKTKERIKIVKNWLEQQPGWLLIFDDVKDYAAIKKYIPQKNGHVIITSRQHHWPEENLAPIEVNIMLEREAVELLQGLSGLDNKALPELKALAKRLGYLPLALEHAGAYLKQTGESVNDYIKQFDDNLGEVIKGGKKELIPSKMATKIIEFTWRASILAIERAEKKARSAPLAKELLTVCAYLNENNIPLSFLLLWIMRQNSNGANKLNPLMTERIKSLAAYSLVKLNQNKKFLSIHIVLQDVIRLADVKTHRSKLGEQSQLLWLENLVVTIGNVGLAWKKLDLKEIDETYSFCFTKKDKILCARTMLYHLVMSHAERLILHYQKLTKHENYALFFMKFVLLQLHPNCNTSFSKAKTWISQMKTYIPQLALPHPNNEKQDDPKEIIAFKRFCYQFLATASMKIEEYNMSIELMNLTIPLTLMLDGKDSANHAVAQCLLSQSYLQLDKLDEAQHYARSALQAYRKHYDEKSYLFIMFKYLTLHSIYAHQLDMPKLKALLEETLPIVIDKLGERDPFVATLRLTQAHLCIDTKKKPIAIDLLERALPVLINNYGHTHTITQLATLPLAVSSTQAGMSKKNSVMITPSYHANEAYSPSTEAKGFASGIVESRNFINRNQPHKATELLEALFKKLVTSYGAQNSKVALITFRLAEIYYQPLHLPKKSQKLLESYTIPILEKHSHINIFSIALKHAENLYAKLAIKFIVESTFPNSGQPSLNKKLKKLIANEKYIDILATLLGKPGVLLKIVPSSQRARMNIAGKTHILLQYLVQFKNRYNQKSIKKGKMDPLLHLAVQDNAPYFTKILLEYGADYDIPDENGKTPIDWAIQLNNPFVTEALKNAITTKYKNKHDLAKLARNLARQNDHEALKLFIHLKVDINQANDIPGFTPLHYAAKKRHQKCIDLLLAAGANSAIIKQFSKQEPSNSALLAASLTSLLKLIVLFLYACTAIFFGFDPVFRMPRGVNTHNAPRLQESPDITLLATSLTNSLGNSSATTPSSNTTVVAESSSMAMKRNR